MDLVWAALLTLGLIGSLFALAYFVENHAAVFVRRIGLRRFAYTLGLGVYCTSWTFYGAVGSTVRDGWSYLPIYLAPIMLLLFAPAFLRKLGEAVTQEQATSVSDFIAARFGHDLVTARLVTIIALLGSVPYVALQLRSIGSAMAVVSGQDVEDPVMLVAAVLLVLFAILFGARRYELAGRSEGLVFAIGIDSLIKIIALTLVAIFSLGLIYESASGDFAPSQAMLIRNFAPENISVNEVTIFLISTMAIIALPRQFYMGLVEARDGQDLVRARYGLTLYIGLMAVLVLPIAYAGYSVLGDSVSADLYVLQLPAYEGNHLIIAAALIGGVSAAASMAIVDTTALATMVSNDLVLASIVRSKDGATPGQIGRQMLWIRRFSIVGIMVLALLWALRISPNDSLASIGLIAFAAMAQFTPHLIMAARGGGRDPLAARFSLGFGLVMWFYTLGLPPILPEHWLFVLEASPLNPSRLFGIGSAEPLVHGVMWSLGGNLTLFALVSARRMHAPALPRLLRGQKKVRDLKGLITLTENFIGRERTLAEFPNAADGGVIDRKSAQRAQELISKVVGVSAARTLVASALADGQMSLLEVTRLLDEGGQSLRFSRQLLAATFENIDAGISVVDADLNLVAWNTRYLDLFDYPPGMVKVGAPVANLIRHNAKRGDFGAGDTEHHVEKRLAHLRAGLVHSFERRRADGRVIKTVGGPMPGGGYVMSFTDITGEALARSELRRTLDELETRVTARTLELSDANRRLARADQEKTRFLAAASHDLLQPLHAARLFVAALGRDVQGPQDSLVARVDGAIVAAEDLLRALLDISRMDAGGITPNQEDVDLKSFLSDLIANFQPVARAKGLNMRLGPAGGVVVSDTGLLRSIMQNFLTNAIRYSERGGILVGTRRRAGMQRIDVIDQGVGIAPESLDIIFSEFTRLGEVEAEGHGLGLALVERTARLLGGRVEVASVKGKGSRFSLVLPAQEACNAPRSDVPEEMPLATPRGDKRRVLVVDNDVRIVDATRALLSALGHESYGARTIADALEMLDHVDALLVDFRLDNGEDGLSLIRLARALKPEIPAVIITAENSDELRQEAMSIGVRILSKPANPATVEQIFSSF